MSDKQTQVEPFDVLKLIQYVFPMVFVILAFGFYFNGQVPAILAWVFAAVGVLEYFLIGLIRIYQKSTITSKLHKA